MYNINGKFLFKIEGPNNGRGDGFQYLMDFAVSQEEAEILAIDYNARKIFVFDSLGEFKKAIKDKEIPYISEDNDCDILKRDLS